MSSELKLGTTFANMTLLTDLSIMLPKVNYAPYSKVLKLADNSYKGMGWATVSWHWNFLPLAQKIILATYISGVSGTVYIRTRKNDESYDNFICTMVLPVGEEISNSKSLSYTIQFINLEVAVS